MGTMTDLYIRNWIKAGERFELKGDGDGLYLSYRENFAILVWRFRYRFVGQPRIMSRCQRGRQNVTHSGSHETRCGGRRETGAEARTRRHISTP